MALADVGKLAAKIACIMLLAIIIDAAICAMTAQWTLEAFTTGLEYAGFVVLLIGGSAIIGASKVRGAVGMHYARSVEPDGIHRSIRQSTKDLMGAYAHCILFGSAGFLLWILAAIIAS